MDSATTVAQGIVNLIQGDTARVVNASISPSAGNVIILTAIAIGSAGNGITFASGATDNTTPATPSFSTNPLNGFLAGGQNAVTPTPVTDHGTVSLTAGSFTTAAIPYGPGTANTTAASVATALANALNITGSEVSASTIGGTSITIRENATGASGNGVQVSTHSSSADPTDFPSPSFSVAPATLSGGADPYSSGIAHPYVTQYSYDGLGDLIQVNQGQQLRTFAYDSLGRMTSVQMPEKLNQAVTVTYTDFGTIATRTDARGVRATYGYDNLGHPASINYSDGTPTVTYSFGATGAANFGAGRLINTTDGVGSESYQYDAMGREIKCTRVIGPNPYIITYAYTPDGRVASTTYPSGRVVTNSYDGIGRLAQVGTGGSSLFNINSYNASGQILSALYGNGIQATYGYNNQQQVTSILIGNASQLLNLSYNWGGTSDDGLLMGVTDNAASARTTSYTYDQLKRLTTAQTVNLTSPNTWQMQFAYDRYGNRLSQTPTGGTATMPSNTVTVDPTTNRITTASYDADGNMANDGINNYTYDAENRITHVNGADNTYAYDGSGLRVNRNGNYYIYASGHVIAEYANGAAAASPTTEYIYARGKRVATVAAGATTYPLWDHLSIRANANSAGTVVRTFGHFPFGETWYETGTHDKWDYTTYENDSESGLNYAMERFHNPRLGRFMSLDPWPADKYHPQTWNRYPHGNNNPISFSDPSGMEGEDDGCGGEGFANCDGNYGDLQDAVPDDGGGKAAGGSTPPAPCGDPNTACDSQGNCIAGECMPNNPPADNNPATTPPPNSPGDPGSTTDDSQPSCCVVIVEIPSQQDPDQQNQNTQQGQQQQQNESCPTTCESHSDLQVTGDIMEGVGGAIFVGCLLAEPCGMIETIGGTFATIGFLMSKADGYVTPNSGNVPGTNVSDPTWFLGLGPH